jgi:xylulose-5-phosphate/fructose-6-phosphate phosphoketolase
MIYVTGPGHGGPGVVASTYLEGTYSELYPHITRTRRAWPGCSASSPSPAASPARGAGDARLDPRGRRARLLAGARLRGGLRQPRPDRGLRDRRRRGRDRAAGRQLALQQVPRPGPGRRGAADPAPERVQDRQPDVLARIPHAELESLLEATGTTVHTVEGDDPKLVHQQLAATMDAVIEEIHASSGGPGPRGDLSRPLWPAIVLRPPRAGPGPRSWTGCRWRAPGGRTRSRSTRPGPTPSTWPSSRSGCAPTGRRSCSTPDGTLIPSWPRWRRDGDRRMSANPHANGGLLLRDLDLPDFRDYAVQVTKPGRSTRPRRPGCSATGCAT